MKESHHFCINLLQKIILSAQFLDKYIDQLPAEKIKKHLNIINESSNKLKEYFGQIR